MPEHTVQTVKQILRKAEQSPKYPYLSLLELRNTRVDNQLESSAQLLEGRHLKSILPVPHDQVGS